MNQRLEEFRQLLQLNQLQGALVQATDVYLNEYVPLEQNRRAYLTGFTGSTGDVLIYQDKAILFVDGRYSIQAKQEAPDCEVRVLPLGLPIASAWMEELEHRSGAQIGINSDHMSVDLYQKLKNHSQKFGYFLQELPAFGPQDLETQQHDIRKISEKMTGESTQERLKRSEAFFRKNRIEAFLVVALDEIAWLSNQRSNEFPYQAVFSARALAYPDHLEISSGPLKIQKKMRVGLDPALTPEALRHDLEQQGAETIFLASPFQHMKSIKNASELNHMRSAIARTDRVVAQIQRWVCEQIEQKKSITEQDVDNRVRLEYQRSGVTGLSFKPICGGGKNAAIIHHGNPEQKECLKAGDLFLLDSGAYYEGGYATDLTRTFLLGGAQQKASEFQKKIFTAVLKASIAGMTARFPKGTKGIQLDAIVRDAIWRCGFNYNHGTGHGVGVNVHEAPPRIAPAGFEPIEESQVFSIEPGIYIENFGGVRIENLCTAIQDPDENDFLRVLPLSFCPLDKRLIEESQITGAEKLFLEYYEKSFPVLL